GTVAGSAASRASPYRSDVRALKPRVRSQHRRQVIFTTAFTGAGLARTSTSPPNTMLRPLIWLLTNRRLGQKLPGSISPITGTNRARFRQRLVDGSGTSERFLTFD